ncbi:MAG TPA: hypothetical protein VMU16_13275 [Candidatus Binataceae bacterium]|nr:hypothetical protein [Candidatus Binataceae bacterium]
MAALRENDRIVMVEKKGFKDDNLRIFVGIVEACDATIIRARGYAFTVSPYDVGGVERRGEERIRIFALETGDVIFVLPPEQDISKMVIKRTAKSMQLSDGVFAMDLTDFLVRG